MDQTTSTEFEGVGTGLAGPMQPLGLCARLPKPGFLARVIALTEPARSLVGDEDGFLSEEIDAEEGEVARVAETVWRMALPSDVEVDVVLLGSSFVLAAAASLSGPVGLGIMGVKVLGAGFIACGGALVARACKRAFASEFLEVIPHVGWASTRKWRRAERSVVNLDQKPELDYAVLAATYARHWEEALDSAYGPEAELPRVAMNDFMDTSGADVWEKTGDELFKEQLRSGTTRNKTWLHAVWKLSVRNRLLRLSYEELKACAEVDDGLLRRLAGAKASWVSTVKARYMISPERLTVLAAAVAVAKDKSREYHGPNPEVFLAGFLSKRLGPHLSGAGARKVFALAARIAAGSDF